MAHLCDREHAGRARAPTRTGAGTNKFNPVPMVGIEAGRRNARNLGCVCTHLGDRVSTRFQRANVTPSTLR